MQTALILGGVLVVAMLLLWWAGRREGRSAARAKAAERTADEARQSLAIDEAVGGLTDAELDAELLRKHKR